VLLYAPGVVVLLYEPVDVPEFMPLLPVVDELLYEPVDEPALPIPDVEPLLLYELPDVDVGRSVLLFVPIVAFRLFSLFVFDVL